MALTMYNSSHGKGFEGKCGNDKKGPFEATPFMHPMRIPRIDDTLLVKA